MQEYKEKSFRFFKKYLSEGRSDRFEQVGEKVLYPFTERRRKVFDGVEENKACEITLFSNRCEARKRYSAIGKGFWLCRKTNYYFMKPMPVPVPLLPHPRVNGLVAQPAGPPGYRSA